LGFVNIQIVVFLCVTPLGLPWSASPLGFAFAWGFVFVGDDALIIPLSRFRRKFWRT
jgi:hypothetical protein